MERKDRIVILGGRGLVGSAVYRLLRREGYQNVLACSRDQLELTDQGAVLTFFRDHQPDYVIMAAGRVGGIAANSSFPWDFAYENLATAVHVLNAVRHTGARKVLMLGSTCIYPRQAPQPIQEEALLSGPLEPTNQWYAVAKIAGVKLGQALRRQHGISVISAMPTNLYGPEDNFHPEHSHVLPGLLQRVHQAKLEGAPQVEIWGSGRARREFLYVDDLAEALLLLLQNYDEEEIINIGGGEDLEIRDLVRQIAAVVGYEGEFVYDRTRPDGTPQKRTDSSRLFRLGWSPRTELRAGLERTYDWFVEALGRSAVRGL